MLCDVLDQSLAGDIGTGAPVILMGSALWQLTGTLDGTVHRSPVFHFQSVFDRRELFLNNSDYVILIWKHKQKRT